MRVSRRYKIVLLLLPLLGCGKEEKSKSNDDKSSAVVAADSTAADACKTKKRVLQVKDGSTINWISTKNGTIPVVGTHLLSGSLASDDKVNLDKLDMTLSFNEDKLNSGVKLRDDRIIQYVFDYASGLRMKFSLDSAEGTDKSTKFPEVGVSMEYELSGKFTVAGTDVPITFTVLVTGTDKGLHVQNAHQDFSLGLTTQLGLTNQVAQLMKLASVTIDEWLEIRLDFDLEDVCK